MHVPVVGGAGRVQTAVVQVRRALCAHADAHHRLQRDRSAGPGGVLPRYETGAGVRVPGVLGPARTAADPVQTGADGHADK